MAVMDERKAKGIKDETGTEASPLPANMNKNEYGAKVRAKLAGQDVIASPSGYQLFTPVIDTFLKEHLFADIFARDVLDYQQEERTSSFGQLALRNSQKVDMKAISLNTLGTVLVLAMTAILPGQARAGGELVKFPENYAEGVLYATVERDNIHEEIFTSREAIEAAKSGQPLPSGTAITLVDYRDGELFRYVVMEKRTGWGADYPPEKRNGEWEFQAFNADKSVNRNENLDRCFSCHKSQENQDFVFTFDQMKSAK